MVGAPFECGAVLVRLLVKFVSHHRLLKRREVPQAERHVVSCQCKERAERDAGKPLAHPVQERLGFIDVKRAVDPLAAIAGSGAGLDPIAGAAAGVTCHW
jgi:hypothetical protein